VPSRAQPQQGELKPLLVISVSSYDKLLADLQYVSKALNDDRYIDRLNAFADRLLQTKGIQIDKAEALDRAKPFGMAIVTDGVAIIPLTILPLDGDAEKLFAWMKPLLGEVKKDDSGLYRFSQGTLSGYIKVAEGWVYFAQLPDQLAVLPDPGGMFDDLARDYHFAVRLSIKEIPEVFRTLAIDQFRVSFESAIQKRPEESDAVWGFRRELGKLQSQLLERGLGESEQVTVGVRLDADQERSQTEVLITPLADSPSSAHLGMLRGAKTRFASLLGGEDKPEVSLVLNMTGPLDQDLLDEYGGMVNAYRDYALELIDKSEDVKSDEERTTLKELATGITDVLGATIAAGQLDLVVRMVEKPKRTLVMAVRVAEADDLQKLVDRISELAQGDPAFTAVKLNAQEHAGTPIHNFTIKPKRGSRDADLAKLFDGEFQLNLAIRDDNLFLAVGGQGADLIKQGLEISETDVPPLKAYMRLNPLIRMFGQTIEQQELRTALSLLSTILGPVDNAWISAEVTGEGRLRLTSETKKGVIKLVGALIGQFGPTLLDLQRGGQMFGRAPSTPKAQAPDNQADQKAPDSKSDSSASPQKQEASEK
jgi:hypothetical protein